MNNSIRKIVMLTTAFSASNVVYSGYSIADYRDNYINNSSYSVNTTHPAQWQFNNQSNYGNNIVETKSEILHNFAKSLINNSSEIDDEFRDILHKHFWDLI